MVFRRDVSNPEGPVSLADGSWVVTEMNRGVISHISADGKRSKNIVRTGGRPNGLALDSNGTFWVAESKHPALLKVTMEGEATVFKTGKEGLPFLWPNDLCFGPDGALYMTDSGVLLDDFEGIQPPEAVYEQEIDGRVFRIDPETGDCTLLDRGLRFANGIAFGHGGEDLYVSETLTGNIYRYRVTDGRVHGKRQLFGNVMFKPPIEYGQVAGPDGMAFDTDGKLYVAVLAQGDITVLNSDGAVRERLDIEGTFPTNLAFAGPGEQRLLVTEGSRNQLLLIEIAAEGLPLNS
ncbi:MAG: SMP-30/gluconolactonase/LRE family protein [Spirochaetaceae bacterium]|nr:SMP-30/gluconolactonase/LRE family protein [Spirochaetaceae bacterium]